MISCPCSSFKYAEQFDKMRTNLHVSYIGSIPSMDGNWETWAEHTGENPFPIQYSLSPVIFHFYSPRFMEANLHIGDIQ